MIEVSDDTVKMDSSPVSSQVGRRSRMSTASSCSAMLSEAVLSQRIVSVESYMAPPAKEFDNTYSDFRCGAVKRVPIIRIFGTTPAGQKLCANIHGVYPYISILDDETGPGLEYRLAEALDSAINDSMILNKFKTGNNFAKSQHVFKITRVVGRTFYGFRSNNEVFLRIFFYNPLILRKAVDLLQNGSVLGRRFQPYEAHIPYSLQFMIDYSLYGMNFIHYSSVKFRRKVTLQNNCQSEEDKPLSQASNISLDGYINPDEIEISMLGPPQLAKLTRCELEVDVLACDILDTKPSGTAVSVNPGINSIWKDEIERRRLQGVASSSQITAPESQERLQAEATHATEDKFQQILWSKIQSFFGENNYVSEFISSPNCSVLEDDQILPSSQVTDHLSGESKHVEAQSYETEDDDLSKLLEEMAMAAQVTDVDESEENRYEQLPAESDSLEDEDINDDLWDDSFLSSSILDKISDEELTRVESETIPSQRNNSPEIIQCDGQANDSDDSSDESSDKILKQDKKVTRQSSRLSKTSEKTQPKGKITSQVTKKTRKSSRLSTAAGPQTSSSAHRLSLAHRRQSRSQEAKSRRNDSSSLPDESSQEAKSKRRGRPVLVQPQHTKQKAKEAPKEKNSVEPNVPLMNSRSLSVEEKPGTSKDAVPVLKKNLQGSSSIVEEKQDSPAENITDVVSPKMLQLNHAKFNPCRVIVKRLNSSASPGSSLPKRDRRKPKRFLEGEDTITPTLPTIINKNNHEAQQVVASTKPDEKIALSTANQSSKSETPPAEKVPVTAAKKRKAERAERTRLLKKNTSTPEITRGNDPMPNPAVKTGPEEQEEVNESQRSLQTQQTLKVPSKRSWTEIKMKKKKKRLGIALGSNTSHQPVKKDAPNFVVQTSFIQNDRECSFAASQSKQQYSHDNISGFPFPEVTSVAQQTEQVQTGISNVQVYPVTASQSSQVSPKMVTIGTQTDRLVSSSESETQTNINHCSSETQTEVVPRLCLCQCACTVKDKTDASVEAQDDLKPATGNKRIQVDNVDMIIKARAARYTTPQSNRIKHATTPFRSPEKHRPSSLESPRRRTPNSATPSRARYLSSLVLKTPTGQHSGRIVHTIQHPRNLSVSTPTEISEGAFSKLTPPSRESKESYLVQSLTFAPSPRKRVSYFKPRNLEGERVLEESKLPEPEVGWEYSADERKSNELTPAATILAESIECELSVNSIYEYDEAPSPKVTTPAGLSSQDLESQPDDSPTSSGAQLSVFQQKRIMSKHRSKTRLEKRKIANQEANRGISDIFEIEYEPLKQPASYKSTMKWLETAKKQGNNSLTPARSRTDDNEEDKLHNLSSDEEEGPPPVKLFGGGNMSDEDDSDAPSSSRKVNNLMQIKPFTPEAIQGGFDFSSQWSARETPKSILRSCGSSARRPNLKVGKRKIRWEDNEPCKRTKFEETIDSQSSVISDRSDNGKEAIAVGGDSLNATADTSELDGPATKNALGLENSMSNLQDAKALHQCQYLTTMCIEIHCESRNELTPDPALDPIVAIFVLISSDYPDNFRRPKECLQLLIASNNTDNHAASAGSQSIKVYPNEASMIDGFIRLVRYWDPDIFVGYEVEKSSFGYLIQRGVFLGRDISSELSRILPPSLERSAGKNPQTHQRPKEEWNGTVCGRIVLNLWRLLRHEIAVQSYTFENAAYHILRRRVHKFSYKLLTEYWSKLVTRTKVIQYYMNRVRGVIQMMEKLDLINRTSELARLFGIQFYEVLSRGSQFRVEGMMLRATKPLDYIAPSPTITQRAKMRAPEYLPLILEPKSNYYTDPVAVLDFQSLYPSMMIAYNYDYASLLGRVEHLGSLDPYSLGCLEHHVHPGELLQLKDKIHVSPAGVAFLDKSFIKGVVPEMLEQILDTRQMVKRAMKKWKNVGASLQKVLDSRQLGLKLIANVTYGYTSANFSGRMPCVEIADSIVSKGRETLQRAIDLVKGNYQRWGGEVVYGDTDSMFVLFRGKTRDEAFKRAYEIAEEVTKANPKPVKLKFEKIYQPCILQTKKRYVGYAYETPDQEKPIYDAKGIETVRRDGCPAVRKILEKSLHVLFTSNKPKKVEDYVKFQFEKLFKGRVSMQDYIFAREYRGRLGYKPTACVPSLEIAKKLTETDPRAEPLIKERVPYVVVYGNPNLPLIKLVRRPEEFLKNPAMRLNAHYYIEKVIIPALNRCLLLAGMNTTKWYLQMPRKYLRNVLEHSKKKGQGTLDGYVLHQNCLRCDGKAEQGLCQDCLSDASSTVIHLQEVLRNSKSKLSGCIEICTSCASEPGQCTSIDCPILHKLTRYERDQAYMKNVERELQNLEW